MSSAPPGLLLPAKNDFSAEAVKNWFDNISVELRSGIFESEEQEYVKSYYTESGLLRRWRRPFFLRHFAETFSEAAAYLFGGKPDPVILDLGCGIGTQALFLALQGAKVVGLDLDDVALRIFRKRKTLYEASCGRQLDINILQENSLQAQYPRHAPIDGVYSLFAFNIMQPSGALLNALVPNLSACARWAVLDGNNVSIWCKLLPSRRRNVWSPAEMRQHLERSGFKVESQRGGVTLPPPVWAVIPYSWAGRLDRWLCRSPFLPVSCQTLAAREMERIDR